MTGISKNFKLSFRRKPESSFFNELWIPTFVGMTHLRGVLR